MRILTLGLLVCVATSVHANPIRDGSVGPDSSVQATGPHFLFDESMGHVTGTVLLHSFDSFSLDTGQSATFTGISPIDYIISRVTGDQVSNLEGAIVSTIESADFFLLNPNGILVGSEASIDVDGSVYLSSANYLSFDTGESIMVQADADLPILDTGSPLAFGFLGGPIAGLNLQGAELELASHSSLQLIGGEISLDSTSIDVESGLVTLVAAAAGTEVLLDATEPGTPGPDWGLVSLRDSEISVDGDANGTIHISSGNLEVVDSEISAGAEDESSPSPLAIDIVTSLAISLSGETEISATTEGEASGGNISLRSDAIALRENSEVVSDTEGSGNAGSVFFDATSITIADDSEVSSDVETGASGSGGDVLITADSILLVGAPEISTDTDPDSSGSGGNIQLIASDNIELDIDFEVGEEAGVLSNSEGQGDAGDISIQTPALSVRGGTVNAMTAGPGLGGNILINSDVVALSEFGSVSVQSTGAGNAGDIEIAGAASLDLASETSISARAELANGGNIRIRDFQRIIARQAEITANVGDSVGGNVNLDARQVVADNSRIVAQAGAGQGGAINVQGEFFFNDSSLVSASAGPAGISGTVTINAPEVDLSASLEALPTNYLDPATLFRQSCAARESGEAEGSFVVIPPSLSPTTIEGLPLDWEQSGMPAASSLGSARTAVLNGESETAASLLLSAQQILQQAGDSSAIVYGLIVGARSYSLLSQIQTPAEADTSVRNALSMLNRARLVAENVNDPLAQSYALGNLALLYSNSLQITEALYLARSAARVAEQAADSSSRYRWLALEGRLLLARNGPDDLPAATDAYRRAVNVIQAANKSELVLADPSGTYFNTEIVPIYQSLVSLLLALGGTAELNSAQAFYQEARLVMEQFKAAELQDYYQDECVSALQANAMALDAVDSGTAVIYPIVLQNRLELLVSINNQIQNFTVDVAADRLEDFVIELRLVLENIEDGHLQLGQQLYQWLIAPYESLLDAADIHTLVFINDGPLRGIPIAALHDGEQFLMQRFALAAAPGLSLVDPEPFTRDAPEIFMAGLSEPVQGFSPLPGVPRELNAVAAAMPGEMLLDDEFLLESVREGLSLQQPSVVHLASHASFGRTQGSSFVLTWDSRLTMDRLSEYVLTTRFRERPLELLVLSACETAVGDSRAALGLAGIAVRAGARSALGSLWTIADEATAELMAGFYRQLRDTGISKAEALRRAQLSLLDHPRYSHPYFWSPFLLINNWL